MNSRRPLYPLLCLLLACEQDPPADPLPDPIGPPLYEHHAAWAPVQNTLYGDVSDLTIQLLSHDGELEVIASLAPNSAATLESEFDAIAHGASIGEFDLGSSTSTRSSSTCRPNAAC